MTTSYNAPTGLTVGLWSREPARRDRATALVRLLMVIPHYVVLFFLGIAAMVVLVVGWFGALFTGRLPAMVEEFLSGYLRWVTRVEAYLWFLTDEYPPFTLQRVEGYPVQLELPQPAELNRLAVFFRILLVIPAAIVSGLLWSGLAVVSIVSWASIVFTGSMPRAIYDAARVVVRFHTRYAAYFWMLTPEYAWGVYGDAPAGTAGAPAFAGGAPADIEPTDGRWLALTSQARTVVTVMLVIGVIAYIANYSRY